MSQIRGATKPPVSEAVSAGIDRALAPLASVLHGLPMFQGIVRGAVEKATYSNLLQMLLTMHHSLESALSAAAHLKGFDAPAFRREESLARDLRILGGHRPVRANEILDHFESVVRTWTRPPCASLIGALYALERERKDLLKLARPLAAALRLKVAARSGLDYLIDGADHAARRLRGLQSWIDSNIRHADRAKDVVEGGCETMRTLTALHRHVSGSTS